jgi:hypothetical protein
VSLRYHALLELLRSLSGADEDDGGSLCNQAVELQQCCELVVVFIDVDVELLDALDGEIFVGKSKLVGVWRKTFGVCEDVWRECSREEHSLAKLGEHPAAVSLVTKLARSYLRLDASALLAQTLLVKHVISFVKHQNLDASGVDQPPPQHVGDGTRCAHKDVRLVLHATSRRVWNGGHRLQALHELAHVCDDAQNLTCELAAGRKNECLGLKVAEVDARQNVEREGSGLAGTGL